MQRIDTTDELFSDGDPQNNVKGTRVTAEWLNTLQEELANAIEGFEYELDPAKQDQLLTLLTYIYESRFYDAYVRCVEQQNTNVGPAESLINNVWVQRVFNQKTDDDAGIATLSSNRITLPAGKYHIFCQAQQGSGSGGLLRLYNVTGSAVLVYGTTGYNTTESAIPLMLKGQFVLAAESQIEIQHLASGSGGNAGVAINCAGINEYYASIEIWRLP